MQLIDLSIVIMSISASSMVMQCPQFRVVNFIKYPVQRIQRLPQRRNRSGEVLTGGSLYLVAPGWLDTSTNGGSKVPIVGRCVFISGTPVTLSALLRSIDGPPEDSSRLLLRRWLWLGETWTRLLLLYVWENVSADDGALEDCGEVLPLRHSGPGPIDADTGTCWPARWNTGTLARCAISISPICQCIASAARHGSCISFEIFSHMSFLNLVG